MEYVLAFAEIAFNHELRHLDFGDIPNSIRSIVIEKLSHFKKLTTLILRSHANAKGQWLFKGVAKDLLTGLEGGIELIF